MSGRNDFPNPDNYPLPSFPSPVDAPSVDPDEGNLITVQYSEEWIAVLMAAVDQLRQYVAWKGTDDDKKLAADRADNLKYLLQEPVEINNDVQTPFWDDKDDVDDTAPPDDQHWYGYVTDPDAPAGELDFVEDASVWVVSGMVALATGSIGVALAFRTFVRNFILTQKRGDVGETIRYVIDGRDMTTIAGDVSGDLASVNMVGDPDLSEHTFYIIKTG